MMMMKLSNKQRKSKSTRMTFISEINQNYKVFFAFVAAVTTAAASPILTFDSLSVITPSAFSSCFSKLLIYLTMMESQQL